MSGVGGLLTTVLRLLMPAWVYRILSLKISFKHISINLETESEFAEDNA